MFFINIAVMPLARSCTCPKELCTQKKKNRKGWARCGAMVWCAMD